MVKTIGDAVMATFPTPDRAVAAALRMREAMRDLNERAHQRDLLLKIGIHEGPCLAVMLNERQDYFGQTVNIAARVQGLAVSRSILATKPVVENPQVSEMLETSGLQPTMRARGLARDRRQDDGISNSLSGLRVGLGTRAAVLKMRADRPQQFNSRPLAAPQRTAVVP